MKNIELEVIVTEEGKLIADVPSDVPAGKHRIVMTIDEEPAQQEREPLQFIVIDAGPWPEDFSLRREDLYDDWGR